MRTTVKELCTINVYIYISYVQTTLLETHTQNFRTLFTLRTVLRDGSADEVVTQGQIIRLNR